MKSKLTSYTALFIIGAFLMLSSCGRKNTGEQPRKRDTTNSAEKENKVSSGGTNSTASNGSLRIETTKTAAVPTSREPADSAWRKKQ